LRCGFADALPNQIDSALGGVGIGDCQGDSLAVFAAYGDNDELARLCCLRNKRRFNIGCEDVIAKLVFRDNFMWHFLASFGSKTRKTQLCKKKAACQGSL
jgi:hypothetical protein